MSILLVEPFSGVSGDMFVSALADLSEAYQEICDLPGRLKLKKVKINFIRVSKNGIVCRQLEIIEENEKTENWHLSDIINLLDRAEISEKAKRNAGEIFKIIASSEAKIHGTSIEKVHFHELSAVDTILDVAGSVILLEKLNITSVYSLPVCTGFGEVKTQHGLLPVPAPAVREILHTIPVYPGDEMGEKTTPTGAAILKWLNPNFNIPPLELKKTGYGPGKSNFISANVLRISQGDLVEEPASLMMMETQIDDMPQEYLSSELLDNLIKSGALDAFYTTINMKKGRNGILLSVLCDSSKQPFLQNYIFSQTTTSGIRFFPVKRTELERENIKVGTSYGKVKAKKIILPNGVVRIKPEYEEIKRIAAQHDEDLYPVYQCIAREIEKQYIKKKNKTQPL